MAETTHTPDAPFRSGITGKYKLLIKGVTPKFGSYEYDLVDGEGKEYKAAAKEHYAKGDSLRCMVSFQVVNARLVVSDVAVCKKQDLASLIPEPPKPEPKPQPKPVSKSKAKTTKPKQKSSTKNTDDKPKKIVLGDPRHRRTSGTYVFRVAEVTKIDSGFSYKVEGAGQQLYEVQSRVSFPVGTFVDCGVKVSSSASGILKIFVSSIKEHISVIVKPVHHRKPSNVLKHWHTDTKSHDAFSGPNPGDRFHLIYTPMGNKR